MLVIMTLLRFTQYIYPSPLMGICWLTSSTYYWLSLMGRLERVLTGLWKVTALSYCPFVKLEDGKVYFKVMACEKKSNTLPLHWKTAFRTWKGKLLCSIKIWILYPNKQYSSSLHSAWAQSYPLICRYIPLDDPMLHYEDNLIWTQ